MADLTGKAISELTEATSVSNSDLIAVSRSGASRKMTLETLVGNLLKKNGDTATGSIAISSSNIDTTVVPSVSQTGQAFNLRDKNNVALASLYPGRTAAGANSVVLAAYQPVSGSNVANYILLGVGATGDPLVSLSSPTAWRNALGLGTAGALPLAIAQGGTGNTAVASETTVSNIATAASGFTIASATYAQWGKLAMLRLNITSANALTANQYISSATILSGKRPVIAAPGTPINTTLVRTYIDTNGTVYIVTTNAVPANTTFYMIYTYLLP